MIQLQLNQSEPITVPSINPRYPTNIFLKKNEEYKFEVIPKEQSWHDGKHLRNITADGKIYPYLILAHLTLRMPFEKWFALLGCINQKGSTNFKIGILKEKYSPPEDGELFCFANDALGFNNYFYTHNNEGTITVTITRTK